MNALGPLLRKFRLSRSLSQEKLAEIAEVSTRHLSFVETGKSSASREMVLVLGSALDLPLRDRNALLLAAGFAPAYRESPLQDLRHVKRAFEHVLAQQEPFGAVVVDRGWNVLMTNTGAQRLLGFFFDDPSSSGGPPEIALTNVMHTIFHPNGLRKYLRNFPEVASAMIERLHRDSALAPDDSVMRKLLTDVLAYPGVGEVLAKTPSAPVQPFLSVHVGKGAVELRLFTILSTLGTPLDVTAQETRIESWFPADDATEAFLRSQA